MRQQWKYTCKTYDYAFARFRNDRKNSERKGITFFVNDSLKKKSNAQNVFWGYPTNYCVGQVLDKNSQHQFMTFVFKWLYHEFNGIMDNIICCKMLK